MNDSRLPQRHVPPSPGAQTMHEPYGNRAYRVYTPEELDTAEDLSDDEDVNYARLFNRKRKPATHFPAEGFIQRYSGYMRNPETRFFTLLNSVLLLIAILLFIMILIWTGFVISYKVVQGSANKKSISTPCLWEWEKWSDCSAACRISSNESFPTKTRKVNMTSIVHPISKNFTDCDTAKLKELVDRAPCNTHICQVQISSLPWDNLKCFAVAQPDGSNRCFMPRVGLDSDALYEVDVPEVFKECTCKPEYTEFVKKLESK